MDGHYRISDWLKRDPTKKINVLQKYFFEKQLIVLIIQKLQLFVLSPHLSLSDRKCQNAHLFGSTIYTSTDQLTYPLCSARTILSDLLKEQSSYYNVENAIS